MSVGVTLTPIAILISEFQQKFATPRQGALAPHSHAELKLLPEFCGKGMLTGLEGFSHVWLISFMHQGGHTRRPGKVRPPRLGERIGLFATRTPHRPNPIGLTLAKIESIREDTLCVSGIDLIHGTPILDIKPYLAAADRPELYRGGWTDQAHKPDVPTQLTSAARAQLCQLFSAERAWRIEKLIEETLRLDPRPRAYLKRETAQFRSAIAGVDVVFEYGADGFCVIGIEKLESI